MGEYRFRLPDFWKLNKSRAACIHVVGMEGIPWPCRVKVAEELLVISRNQNDSGKVHIPYPFETRGEMAICTGTLPESSQVYDLMTELARGTLNRLRNQLSTWGEGGLEIADSLLEQVAQATRHLSASVVSVEPLEKDEAAMKSIEIAIDCIFELSRIFGESISAYRVSQKQLAPFWLAGNLASHPVSQTAEMGSCFDLFEVPWVSPAVQAGGDPKNLIVGPLLDASAGAQTWPGDSTDDFETRKKNLLSECRERLSHLPSHTSLVHAVSGLNGIGHRQLSFPQQQQLTTELFQVIQDASLEIPIVASFDFPWAERLAGSVGGMHPLQVADSLLRQALPISFIGLDVNLDYWPAGSVARDPLQWIDLIDVWGQLGLPLIFCLRIPQGVEPGVAKESAGKAGNHMRAGMSDEQRLELVEVVLSMLIARPNVHGCLFRQWSDDDDLRYPGAGLVTAGDEPKAILQEIDRYHRDVLNRG
ncbi:MAG: hypothetical protein MK106_10070 [Mariniblastus sp.]|nr:hypothetical protein [Mariniblastus sp.]